MTTFRTSVPVILFGFTLGSLKGLANGFNCSMGSLSSVKVAAFKQLTLFERSVAVSVWNGFSHYTPHGLRRLKFFVKVAFVVPSCTTYVIGMVRLPGFQNAVGAKSFLKKNARFLPGVLFLRPF